MILLARTTPLAGVAKKSEGLSIFLVDLREAVGRGPTLRPIPNMVNHDTHEPFFENLEIPAENLIGEEGRRFDAGEPCGAEANMAKYLAAQASWEAANAAIQFHGGFGFACEYDVERKFRETRLYQVAPISTNLILAYVAEHVLGLPRSF
jgi:acyl-CoA dehydrogenase